MIVPQQTSFTPLNEEDSHKVTHKMNGKNSTVIHQDIINEMKPKPVAPIPTATVDYFALLASARVRPTDIIEKQPGCLFIEKDGAEYVIASLGDISTVTGKPKAKKTFAVCIAIAAAVARLVVLGCIKGTFPADKQTVMLFDTEQSKYHVLRAVRRICRLCGIADPPNLIVYSLRPFSPAERLKIIDFALNNTPGIGLVVIDGVRDLAVDPILDNEEASHIMTHLLKWTTDLQIHIMTVLHQNKADRNVRGVLGTELANKSESVIEVIRDESERNISHVEPKDCRNPEFPAFSFSVDDNGLPHLVENGGPRNERAVSTPFGSRRQKKPDLPTADNMTAETVDSIVRRAFGQDAHLRYSQLLVAVTEASEFVGTSLSKNRAEAFITRMLKGNYIVKFKPEKSRYEVYQLASNSDAIQPS